MFEFERSFQDFVHTSLPEPNMLHQAMKYSLLTGGKRIRPLFVLEAAELVSLPKPVALQCAYALEIVHAFSLVHDDLPSMDNDDFRRGLPTTHRKFGEAQALLAGDALLNFAHQTFQNCFTTTSRESYSRAFKLFSDAIQGMILGQSEELKVDQANVDELLRVQSLKTGKLFHASILCPLLLSGILPTDPLYLECERFAEGFGFAFQIADDLEDEAQDQIQNTKNILSHLGRDRAIQLAVQKLNASKYAERFSAAKLLISKLK